MRFPLLPLCLLAAAITSGCSTAQHNRTSENPFDEPLAAPEVVRTHSSSRPAAIVETPTTPAIPTLLNPPQVLPAEESDVQVFALGDTPYTPVAVPLAGDGVSSDRAVQDQVSTSNGNSAAGDVLQEAHRVGSTGDAAGQISLLEQAGYMGNADAFYELAKIYLTGAGVEKTPDVAVGYLNAAMNLGHAEATRVLGWLYAMGSGVRKDVPYGETLLAKAAETSIRAQREYGMALTNQRIPHLNDMERGLEYLKAASSAGDAEATAAFNKAFTPRAETVEAGNPAPTATLSRVADQAAPREIIQDGGASLEARGRSGDLAAIYQVALNWSLGRLRTEGDPQFKAYCWYSVAAARGYAPANEEVRSLAGVKTLADKKYPGRMDACIAELNSAIDGY